MIFKIYLPAVFAEASVAVARTRSLVWSRADESVGPQRTAKVIALAKISPDFPALAQDGARVATAICVAHTSAASAAVSHVNSRAVVRLASFAVGIPFTGEALALRPEKSNVAIALAALKGAFSAAFFIAPFNILSMVMRTLKLLH